MNLRLFVSVAAIALASPASASVVYSYAPDEHLPIYQVDGPNAAAGYNWAHQVVFGSNVTLTGMAFYSTTENPWGTVGTSVVVRIWTGATQPTSLVTQFNDVLDAVDFDGTTAFNNANVRDMARKFTDFDIPIALAAGTYWFGMSGTFFDLNQGISSDGGNTQLLQGPNALIHQYNGLNTYIRLYSNATATPEPGMLGLLGFGLVGLAALRRRRRKSA